MNKARVHLLIRVGNRPPMSFRTDALVVAKDPESAVAQAFAHARYSLEACGIREFQLTDLSVDWGIGA